MCVYINVCVGSEGPCRKSNIKFFIIREFFFYYVLKIFYSKLNAIFFIMIRFLQFRINFCLFKIYIMVLHEICDLQFMRNFI